LVEAFVEKAAPCKLLCLLNVDTDGFRGYKRFFVCADSHKINPKVIFNRVRHCQARPAGGKVDFFAEPACFIGSQYLQRSRGKELLE
jgi:hypothetical protein